jgi:hypothetical protein
MIHDEHTQLLAERGTLQQILDGIPEDSVLVRSGFLARLQEVEQRIEATSAAVRKPARARLAFRGRPVVGGHGVFADFGTDATGEFVRVVTALAGALATPLGSSGPIPNRDQNRLLITSTAVGSFGFELEEYLEPQGDQLPLGLEVETALAQALAQTQELLQSTLESDDELADAVTNIDPRARTAVRTFLDTLASNEATFDLEFGDRVVRFHDVGEVRRSMDRLGQENLHEDLESLTGTFQGVLPKQRTFEFKLDDSEQVVTGKVGMQVANPDVLNQHLNEPARIQVTAVRVGTGRPRYVLNELPVWLEKSRQSEAQ